MKIIDGQKGKHCDEAEYLTYTHKRCPACNVIKVVGLFYKKTTRTTRRWAWDSHCIECRRKECQQYGKNTREQRNSRLQRWRKKNPVAAKANDHRKHLKQKYDLSEEEVEAMRVAQDGQCAICHRATSRLFIDHCHITNHIRALLCQTCNTFLGWYEKKAETILRFQRYLDNHSK